MVEKPGCGRAFLYAYFRAAGVMGTLHADFAGYCRYALDSFAFW